MALFHVFNNGQISRSMVVTPPMFGPEWALHEPIMGHGHIMGPIWARPSWAIGQSWAQHDMGPYWAQSGFIFGPYLVNHGPMLSKSVCPKCVYGLQ